MVSTIAPPPHVITQTPKGIVGVNGGGGGAFNLSYVKCGFIMRFHKHKTF